MSPSADWQSPKAGIHEIIQFGAFSFSHACSAWFKSRSMAQLISRSMPANDFTFFRRFLAGWAYGLRATRKTNEKQTLGLGITHIFCRVGFPHWCEILKSWFRKVFSGFLQDLLVQRCARHKKAWNLETLNSNRLELSQQSCAARPHKSIVVWFFTAD